MDYSAMKDDFGGASEPIRINEINGLWTYLKTIEWSDPWFSGLGAFHVTCAVLTVLTRSRGVVQAVYFSSLMVLVFCAEMINEWAAANWQLFSRQQYFDSNGLFISVVFSVPLLVNCLVIVVSWLWDVGLLIANVKTLKIQEQQRLADRSRTKKQGTTDTAQAPGGSKKQGTTDPTQAPGGSKKHN